MGILHLDSQQRPQLIARDLDLQETTLSTSPSAYLADSALPATSIMASDNLPTLVVIYEPEPGLIVLGRDEIYFYQVTKFDQKGKGVGKNQSPRKERGKNNQVKRRKPKSTVKWPWDEITAYEPHFSCIMVILSSLIVGLA